MSDINIREYENIGSTLMVYCSCRIRGQLTPNIDPSLPKKARGWANQAHCSRCGKEFQVMKVDMVIVGITRMHTGLFGSKEEHERHLCFIKARKDGTHWISPIGNLKDEKDNGDNEFGEKLKDEIRNYLNGGALLE